MTCFSFSLCLPALVHTQRHFHTYIRCAHSSFTRIAFSILPLLPFVPYCISTYFLAYQTNHMKRRNCNDKCVLLDIHSCSWFECNKLRRFIYATSIDCITWILRSRNGAKTEQCLLFAVNIVYFSFILLIYDLGHLSLQEESFNFSISTCIPRRRHLSDGNTVD